MGENGGKPAQDLENYVAKCVTSVCGSAKPMIPKGPGRKWAVRAEEPPVSSEASERVRESQALEPAEPV